MKHIHPFFLLALLLGTACAQGPVAVDYSNDSLRVVQAEWHTDSLDGFLLRRYHFGEGSLFCSAQHLFVVEIPADSPRRLAFAYDSATAPVSELATRAGALAAVNGSYFDMDHGNPICFLRIDGQQLGENTPQRTDTANRKYYQYATLTLHDGHPLLRVPDSNRHHEELWECPDVMTAGPMLLREGRDVPQRTDLSFVSHRHNRTALGIRPDGTTLLVVADGRFRHQAEGFSLPELQRVMRWLGCTEAINLDGGGSSTLYVQGIGDGVVNYPSDNRLHDHHGQRPVSNAIIVR